MKLAGPPRMLKTQKHVRLVLVNGFLGAGKTTVLSALAEYFSALGKKVGYITNDQAAHLVDTALIRRQGIPVAEVAGGCFCCRFTDLLDAAQEVLSQEVDIVLCEPVGSCTDMVATVLEPIREFYGLQFEVAPFTVLADPGKVRAMLLQEQPSAFPFEVDYIFRKQLEEADALLLTKADTLSVEDASRYMAVLERLYGKSVQSVSAFRRDSIAAWGASLFDGTSRGEYILKDIDYDTYAKGEAVLGWLNATIAVIGHPTFDPLTLVQGLMSLVQRRCQQSDAGIAHIKLVLSEGDRLLRANLTANENAPDYSAVSWRSARQARLVLNARVETDPETLKGIVTDALQEARAFCTATSKIETLQSFSPAYPQPLFRVG